MEEGKCIGHHLKDFDLALVGTYLVKPGGCDGIRTADDVVRRVRLFASSYRHVLLEGILVAHTFKRYNALAHELEQQGYDYRFLFLDTPMARCISRVRERRRVTGNQAPFNPRNVIHDHKRIWGCIRLQTKEAGRTTEIIPHTDPLPRILELLHL
jgi:hypothetical protein